MERRYFFAFEGDLFRADSIHEIAVVDAARKQSQCQAGATQYGMTRHQHDIHFSVLYTRFRSNHRFVAPLVCVSERDKKSLVGDVQTVANDMIGLRLVTKRHFQGVLQIRHETAFVATGEVIRYHRIKTRATRAHEQASVCQTVVHIDRLAVINHLQCFLRTNRNIQMTSKPVSAPHRQDTQGGLGVFQPSCHFVHRAIAAYGYYGIKAHARVLMRKLCGMTCVIRKNDIRQPLLHIQRLHDQLR